MLAQNFCKIFLIDLILALDNFLSDSAWYKGPFSVLDVTYTLILCLHNPIFNHVNPKNNFYKKIHIRQKNTNIVWLTKNNKKKKKKKKKKHVQVRVLP